MANLLERFKQLMPASAVQNELHEIDERTVKHEVTQRNAVTKEGSALLEPISTNRSFVTPQSTPVPSGTVLSCNSSLSSGDVATIDPRATLEPLTVWAALHAAIPECLEIIKENKHLIAWLEYRSPSGYWVNTPPINSTRTALERLVAAIAAKAPDAVIVAMKAARDLHPEINPARSASSVQLARFSRKEISA